jgi:uncharacterized membrane protein
VAHRSVRYAREDPEFGRAIGFVDATFALALTLLVTTLEVDDPASAWNSWGSFSDVLGGQLLAFAISFAVVAGYWLAHHRLLAAFAAIDVPTIAVNLLLIASIVLLPFATSSVGDPAVEDEPLPTVVLAIDVAAASVLHTLVYVVAYRRGLLLVRPTPRERSGQVLIGLVPAVVFLASIPVAYLASPQAAWLSWLSLLVLRPLARYGVARSTAAREGDPA